MAGSSDKLECLADEIHALTERRRRNVDAQKIAGLARKSKRRQPQVCQNQQTCKSQHRKTCVQVNGKCKHARNKRFTRILNKR